jgi:hypothetical protein
MYMFVQNKPLVSSDIMLVNVDAFDYENIIEDFISFPRVPSSLLSTHCQKPLATQKALLVGSGRAAPELRTPGPTLPRGLGSGDKKIFSF